MNYPPCFENQAHYDEYIELSKDSGVNEPEKNFCLDCTMNYKARMLSETKCSRPDSIFLLKREEDTGELEVVGVS